jgi:hypothetical protein
MDRVNLRCKVEGLSPQEAQVRIALVALAVLSVAIAITASALNAIANSNSETEPRRNDLTHGSAVHYGIVHVTMPKGKKAFPPELVPVP